MSDQTLKGEERTRFPGLLALGVGALVVVLVVAATVVEPDYGIPVAILAGICTIAALGYRFLAGQNRGQGGDADATDTVPKQPARGERPLGDTPEAHDELSPHDVPLDSPVRHEVADAAGDAEATTRGASAQAAGGASRFHDREESAG